jgi:hypothetical protein
MTRRQWMILGSLSLIVVALAIALVYVLLTAPSSASSAPVVRPQKTYAVPVAAVTARSAYAVAQETALKWREDAYLTSASALWPKATTDTFREPAAWNYQFYSPSAGKVNIIAVQGGEATSLRQSYAPYILSAISVETWQVDSPQALVAWLNAGGGYFLRGRTLVDVHATLRYDGQGGQTMWYVTGLDSGGEDSFGHTVKAEP